MEKYKMFQKATLKMSASKRGEYTGWFKRPHLRQCQRTYCQYVVLHFVYASDRARCSFSFSIFLLKILQGVHNNNSAQCTCGHKRNAKTTNTETTSENEG